MKDEIVLDLGDGYGSVLVEAVGRTGDGDEGLVPAGALDQVLQVPVTVKEFLQKPLTGIGVALARSLPKISDTADYELDEFSVEFQVGGAIEVGADAGAVVKLTPSGTFKCVYTWRRRVDQPADPLEEIA